jgi:hypothetical protein
MLKEAKPLKHALHIDDAEVEANRVDAWARLYGTLDLYAKPPQTPQSHQAYLRLGAKAAGGQGWVFRSNVTSDSGRT